MARVDYEGHAETFRRTRTLPPDVLEGWGRAVRGLGLAGGGGVLDLGAGTGGFLEPLQDWFGSPVIAVEPSAAMRGDALRTGMARRFPYVAGAAEALPLAGGSVDVAWLSTVVHQFADRAGAARELRRVVRRSGHVLIRGFFSDLPMTGLFEHFPGIERSAATFPSTAEVTVDFEAAGFTCESVIDVVEPWRFDLEQWSSRIWSLRDVDSGLKPLTDDEVAAGIAAVTAAHGGGDGPIHSDGTLRLVVFGG